MKKGYILTLATTALLLGACSTTDGSETESTAVADVGTEQVSDSSATESVVSSEESSSESVEEVVEEEPADDKPNGKRSNPYPFDYKTTITGDEFTESGSFPFEMTMQFSNPIFGEDAWSYIQAQNPYNEPAPEGYEWMVFDITAELLKGSVDDAYMPMTEFSTVSSSGNSSPEGYYVTYENMSDNFGEPELYEGSVATGKKAVLIPVGDTGATIKMNLDWSMDAFFGFPQ